MVWLGDIGGEREIKVSRELLSKVISTYKKAKIEAYLNLLLFPFHLGTSQPFPSTLFSPSVCVLYLLALSNHHCSGIQTPLPLLSSQPSSTHYLKA